MRRRGRRRAVGGELQDPEPRKEGGANQLQIRRGLFLAVLGTGVLHIYALIMQTYLRGGGVPLAHFDMQIQTAPISWFF